MKNKKHLPPHLALIMDQRKQDYKAYPITTSNLVLFKEGEGKETAEVRLDIIDEGDGPCLSLVRFMYKPDGSIKEDAMRINMSEASLDSILNFIKLALRHKEYSFSYNEVFEPKGGKALPVTASCEKMLGLNDMIKMLEIAKDPKKLDMLISDLKVLKKQYDNKPTFYKNIEEKLSVENPIYKLAGNKPMKKAYKPIIHENLPMPDIEYQEGFDFEPVDLPQVNHAEIAYANVNVNNN